MNYNRAVAISLNAILVAAAVLAGFIITAPEGNNTPGLIGAVLLGAVAGGGFVWSLTKNDVADQEGDA